MPAPSEEESPQFACRVGHSYTREGLLVDQDRTRENVLWASVRALEESAELRRRVAQRMRKLQHAPLAERNLRHADEAERHARDLRQLLEGREPAESSSETIS